MESRNIRQLERNVAELVAAGEVVERPASVVKELVENCIDAGATSVTAEIKRGGIDFIRVTDNGCGIAPGEVTLAFSRHATSKISSAEDLFSIQTLGFRGEALASICAMSRTEMITKRPDSDLGYRVIAQGGEFFDAYETGCPDGTTVIVRDLFYNTPARLKFLKSEAHEGTLCADVVSKAAMAHPEVSFRLLRDGREIFYTPGNGRLYSAIYSVLGKEFAAAVSQVEYSYKAVSVSGYTVNPHAGQGNRNGQVFFVNGRFVKNRVCSAAVDQAYKNLMPSGRFAACVLNISLPPELVDVNIHPAKTEIKFSDEKIVFSAVYYAVKTAMDTGEVSPAITAGGFERISEAPMPEQNIRLPEPAPVLREAGAAGETEARPQTDFTEKVAGFGLSRAAPEPPEGGVAPPSVPAPPKAGQAEGELRSEAGFEDEEAPAVKVYGEIFETYILAEAGGVFYLIDKHAAHERILFEEIKAKVGEGDGLAGQLLLQPVNIWAEPRERQALLENAGLVSRLGFLVEDFGDSLLLRAAPEYLDIDQAKNLLSEIAAQLLSSHGKISNDALDELIHTAACKAAIKASRESREAELFTIAQRVLGDRAIRYCPHGRPVLVTMKKSEIDRRFGRI